MPIADTGNERIYIPQLRATRWTGCCTINTGMTKYRKGPTKDLQRTTKEHYTGPQRIGNHEKTARLATFLFNFLKLFCLFFVLLYFFVCVFCEFWSFNELWRFTKQPFWDPCTFVKGRQHNFYGTAIFMYRRSTPKIRYLMHAVARQS